MLRRYRAVFLIIVMALLMVPVGEIHATGPFYPCPEPSECCFYNCSGAGGGGHCTWHYTDYPYNTQMAIVC
jgi:hypothetical protein